MDNQEEIKRGEWLQSFLELTENQILSAEEKASALTIKSAGAKPILDEQEPSLLSSAMKNKLVSIIFIAALIISTFDIFKTVGFYMAQKQELAFYIGVGINPQFEAVVQQFAIVLLAEFAVITFLVEWRKWVKRNEWVGKRGFVMSFVHVYFGLSMLAVSLVYWANWMAGFHPLVAVIVPSITLGVGWLTEEDLSDAILKYEGVKTTFETKLFDWTELTKEPKKHKDYEQNLVRVIWAELKRKNTKRNVEIDVPNSYKGAAVAREFQKAEWAKNFIENKERYTESIRVKIPVKSELHDLRAKMELQSKGKIESESGNYAVNMTKLTFLNKETGEETKKDSLRALKTFVTYQIKQQEGE